MSAEAAAEADADRRRVAYRQLVDGDLATGPLGTVALLVPSVVLGEADGALVAAAGLGLALHELGYGVRIVPRHRWHLTGPVDLWVATTPDADPSLAPAEAWTVAWARAEVPAWSRLHHLTAYHQVLPGSEVAASMLRTRTPRVGAVLRAGVDEQLFRPGGRPVTDPPRAVSIGARPVRRAPTLPLLAGLRTEVPLVLHAEPHRSMPDALLARLAPEVPWLRAPGVLAEALVAVDESTHDAIAGGVLDARFFEALAVGAMPVVTSRLGAAELGLDVPCARTSAELAEVVGGLLDDPAATRRRAQELRERVLAAHTWRHRAEALHVEVARARSDADRDRPPSRALHYFPDYTRSNPYQRMLFAGLGETDAYPVAVDDLVAHLETHAVSARPGLLNVHWTTPVLQYAEGPFRASLELDRLGAALDHFRAAGGRLVWTLHNVLPHEARLVWAETELAQLLADRADAIHALSAVTAEQAAEVLRLDPRRVVVIEHSSYVGWYADWVSQEAARRTLGIPPDERVLVALGGIRPYKGLGRLLDVFHDLQEDDSRLRLLIAGAPVQSEESDGLLRRCEQSPRVISHFSHLPDDQLQVWYRASDLAVLPYSRILNSGVFWLAQTFGLPIVGPRTGALVEMADAPHVRLFSPRDDSSLRETLTGALDDLVADPERAAEARRASYAAALSRPPEQMASDFAAFVDHLMPGVAR